MIMVGADIMTMALAAAAVDRRRTRSVQGTVLDDVTPAAVTEAPEPTVTRQQRRHAERQEGKQRQQRLRAAERKDKRHGNV